MTITWNTDITSETSSDRIKFNNILANGSSLLKNVNNCKKIENILYEYIIKLPKTTDDDLNSLGTKLIGIDLSDIKARWVIFLVLESPRIRKSVRIKLLSELTNYGVPRDFSNIEDVSYVFSVIIILSALGRIRNLSNKKAYYSLLENCNKYNLKRNINIFDSFALTLLSEGAFFKSLDLSLKAIEEYFDSQNYRNINDIIDLSNWIIAVNEKELSDKNKSFIKQVPKNFLSKDFFQNRVFRGFRRNLARKYGFERGIKANFEIDDWIKPFNQPLDGQIILLIEWFLAMARAYNKIMEKYNDEMREKHKSKISTIRENIESYIIGNEREKEYLNWLYSFEV